MWKLCPNLHHMLRIVTHLIQAHHPLVVLLTFVTIKFCKRIVASHGGYFPSSCAPLNTAWPLLSLHSYIFQTTDLPFASFTEFVLLASQLLKALFVSCLLQQLVSGFSLTSLFMPCHFCWQFSFMNIGVVLFLCCSLSLGDSIYFQCFGCLLEDKAQIFYLDLLSKL